MVLGGHNAGEVASKMACDIISQKFNEVAHGQGAKTIFGESNASLSPDANQLISSIRLANQIVFEASQKYAQNKGMGTTIVAVLVRKKSYVIAWVGDSRIYLVRHNAIEQVTTDHSLVQEQIDKGLITEEQGEKTDYKNVLTRAVGVAESVNVDIHEIPAMDGDYLILCSDGLTRKVDKTMIYGTVKQNQENPQQIADSLVDLANERDGKDNVTVMTLYKEPRNFWERIFGFLK